MCRSRCNNVTEAEWASATSEQHTRSSEGCTLPPRLEDSCAAVNARYLYLLRCLNARRTCWRSHVRQQECLQHREESGRWLQALIRSHSAPVGDFQGRSLCNSRGAILPEASEQGASRNARPRGQPRPLSSFSFHGAISYPVVAPFSLQLRA